MSTPKVVDVEVGCSSLHRISVSVSESVFVPRLSGTSGRMTWATDITGLTILLLLSVSGKTLSGPIWSCISLSGASGVSLGPLEFLLGLWITWRSSCTG